MRIAHILDRAARARAAKPTGKRRSARPGLECLETRDLMATLGASLDSSKVLTITGTPAADTIRVHQVNDALRVEGIKIIQNGNSLSSVPKASVAKIVVKAGGGNDLIDLRSNSYSDSQLIRIPATIAGGEGDDTIYGTEAGDTIDSGAGNDKVFGYGGNDTIDVRVGRDRVNGGAGDDVINAELAFDTLEVAKSGRLFYDESFAPGNGTDTVNVSLNRETFATRLLNPVVKELQVATYTFQPVLDLLNQKVPVLSRYDGNLTYRRLLSAASPKLGQFTSAIDTIRGLSNSASLSGWVDIGSFKVKSGSSPTISTVWADPLAKLGSSSVNAARKAGVVFGLLEDPQSAVRMMMGRNIELVSLRLAMPRAEAGIDKTYPVMLLGPFTIEANLGGKVWASAGATFGVDMKGIWDGRLIRGFFVEKASASVGAEAWAKGGVALGVSKVLSIGSIKGYGSLGGTINFNTAAGKTYLADLPQSYSRSFKASGQLTYDVGIEVKYSQLVTSYWKGIPYPEWVGKTHRESFGKGTFRV